MTGRIVITTKDSGDTSWMRRGKCVGLDPELLYPQNTEEAKVAKAVCAGCPVITDCLEYAIRNREQFGVFGGRTVPERKRIISERIRNGTLERSRPEATPIRHGERNQYQRCKRANGEACVICKVGHVAEVAAFKAQRKAAS